VFFNKFLGDAFRQRYDEMAITHTEYFRDSRLANEALMIGMALIDQNKVKVETPDGLAFEQECEGLLQLAGYFVERTPMSGDFGVDLLARKNGLTYAIQCKYYGVPVGISAVQEAAAGRQFGRLRRRSRALRIYNSGPPTCRVEFCSTDRIVTARRSARPRSCAAMRR
jgi:hypothetical protein